LYKISNVVGVASLKQ